jgi:hypothetical protein
MLFSNLSMHGAGQNRGLAGDVCFLAPSEGCIPMIAVFCSPRSRVSARGSGICRERFPALKVLWLVVVGRVGA